MIYIGARCDFCKIDFHRASYARHLKTKKRLGKMSDNNVITPTRSPMERLERKDFIVSDTKVENLYCLTDRILKVAYGFTTDNHHSNHANSLLTITSKVNNTGFGLY